ncbi:FecCD family ABC transporter permease [Aeromicrobium choanae]|uniref:Iron complex transport system permease protein n=1 Tax=Aeromicrobium choanae TaxID=1736691 RepID=A0A1T4Z5Z7_9ACTN|nr:iron ABC transporter permease [Aeromicrobium choanae]SKB09470.1 iron complex transport system permease protein [Aeromicrobium choanae]
MTTTVQARPDGTRRTRMPLAVLGLSVALLAAVAASLLVGTETLAPDRALAGLLGHGDAEAEALMQSYRLPRTLVAIFVGAALGTAGALIQAYTRNPLADPGILGVNDGAALGVTVAVALGATGAVGTLVWPALAGAGVATLAVLLLAATGRGPATPLRMTLAGVALAAVLAGVATAIRLSDPDTFERFRSWAAGSVAGRSLDDLAGVVPYIVAGLVLGLVLLKALNAVALGDDVAASLGVDPRRTRLLTVLSVTLLVGSATAVAGPIWFLGLMVPHVCRLLVGNDHARIVPLSMLAAPTILLLADTLARVAVPLREMPVGVVTAFVGAPVLIWLISGRQVHTQ